LHETTDDTCATTRSCGAAWRLMRRRIDAAGPPLHGDQGGLAS
jgi:hypothetical protein